MSYMYHLPFEIDAERFGVLRFWDEPEGYKSRSQVEKAFEKAYTESLENPRKLFFDCIPIENRCRDEFIKSGGKTRIFNIRDESR